MGDEDRVHKKKEAQYQKEQAARANLLKLTVKGRQEQLALKAKWKADELAQDKLRIAHTMRENERLEELEKQAAAQQAQLGKTTRRLSRSRSAKRRTLVQGRSRANTCSSGRCSTP